jgi:F0F1-type ATP synthase beta subunit
MPSYNVQGILKGKFWITTIKEDTLVAESEYFCGEFEQLVRLVQKYRKFQDVSLHFSEEEIEILGYRPITTEEKAAVEKAKRIEQQKKNKTKQAKIEAAQKLLKEEGLL